MSIWQILLFVIDRLVLWLVSLTMIYWPVMILAVVGQLAIWIMDGVGWRSSVPALLLLPFASALGWTLVFGRMGP